MGNGFRWGRWGGKEVQHTPVRVDTPTGRGLFSGVPEEDRKTTRKNVLQGCRRERLLRFCAAEISGRIRSGNEEKLVIGG
jgi:hypothetical protein